MRRIAKDLFADLFQKDQLQHFVSDARCFRSLFYKEDPAGHCRLEASGCTACTARFKIQDIFSQNDQLQQYLQFLLRQDKKENQI